MFRKFKVGTLVGKRTWGGLVGVLGFPEFIVDGYVDLSRGFSQGFADTSNGNVEKLSGHAARSIDDFTKDFKSFFEG